MFDLKSERVRYRVTQEQLAEKLNVSQSTIVRWEKRPENLTLKQYQSIMEVFEHANANN